MAYPRGYGFESAPQQDWDTLPPDYGADTLPYPPSARVGEVRRDQSHPGRESGYSHYNRGSGEYDNREFAGVGGVGEHGNVLTGDLEDNLYRDGADDTRDLYIGAYSRSDQYRPEDVRDMYRGDPEDVRDFNGAHSGTELYTDEPADRALHPRADRMASFGAGRQPADVFREPDTDYTYIDEGQLGRRQDVTGANSASRHPERSISFSAGAARQPNGEAHPANGAILRNRHSARGVDNAGFALDEVDNRAPRGRRFLPRSKSQYERRPHRRGGGAHDDDDKDSVETLVPEISHEDMQRTMNFLATIRVKRRQRKSLKRRDTERDRTDDEEQADDADTEDVGMPSQRAHPKPKSLTERLQEARQQATAEVANSLRNSVWDIDPAIKAITTRVWEKKLSWLKDSLWELEVWAHHFKEIEGRFGSATVSYFRFTRWLVFLNLFIFLVTFSAIVVPLLAEHGPEIFKNADNMYPSNQSANENYSFWEKAQNCSAKYHEELDNLTSHLPVTERVLGFVIGTGWMEKTSMFYGSYQNCTFQRKGVDYNYNMGLAYILAVGIVFLVSFILIVLNSSQAVKDAVTTDEEQSSVHFTNSVLCGWDFCIMDEKSARSKKRILLQEFKADLLEQSKRLEREGLTGNQKLVLFIIRFFVNALVLIILGGCGYLIYYTTDKLLELRKTVKDPVLILLVQFLPSVTITLLNFVVPLIFEALVALEDYRPAFELKIVLVRCVLLRLSSIGVLVVALYYTLHFEGNASNPVPCPEEERNMTQVKRCCGNLMWDTVHKNVTRGLSNVKCWETYVGQQFYKLALVDFAAVLVKTFIGEFPRKLIYENFKEHFTLVGKFGQQFFDLPENVLDIVYTQTLSWLGMFFAPLLPAMTLIKVFLIFYIKKLTLVMNFSPPQYAYKASTSNSFFMTILLVSFILAAAVLGYMIGHLPPSKSCGPFRVYSHEDYVIWSALTDEISTWTQSASEFFFFFGTPTFFVPAFVVLCLLMYCYWAMAQGYKKMESLVQAQLKMEGKDKQFLLARVNDIIKFGNIPEPPSGGPDGMN